MESTPIPVRCVRPVGVLQPPRRRCPGRPGERRHRHVRRRCSLVTGLVLVSDRQAQLSERSRRASRGV